MPFGHSVASYFRKVVVADPLHDTQYHYVPTEWICALFVGLYGISTILHITQAIRYRTWSMLPTVGLGGTLEVVGWAARLWASFNPVLRGPFIIQICTLIIGPTPLLAANFVTLGWIINYLGPQYSRLAPRWYTILFCSCDLVALVVQGTGGGLASTALTFKGAQTGGHIVLAGIVFQLSVMIVYSLCKAEFLFRYHHDTPVRGLDGTVPLRKGQISPRIKMMLFALGFNTLCLVTRGIYRTVELANGWDGRVISTQLYFNVLDGGMVVLAFYTLNFFHPGRLLRDVRKPVLGSGLSEATLTTSNPRLNEKGHSGAQSIQAA